MLLLFHEFKKMPLKIISCEIQIGSTNLHIKREEKEHFFKIKGHQISLTLIKERKRYVLENSSWCIVYDMTSIISVLIFFFLTIEKICN